MCDPLPQQPYEPPLPDGGAKPFRVDLPESVLADLRERLDRTRWPDGIPGSGWGYGTSLSYARELAAYWKDKYDWRAQEARLNAFEQYTVPMGGIDVHFIHERAEGDEPVPILLLHGWPSSVWEFHKIVRPLALRPVGAAASASSCRRCPATDSRFGPSRTGSASSSARAPSRSS